jgi:RNA polymerase sigma factor (sigma-70 family)
MAQQGDNSLSQWMADFNPVGNLSKFDLSEPKFFVRDIYLDYEQWENIAETRQPWYEYNHSSSDRNETEAIYGMIMPRLWEIISLGLSSRQSEVFTLYFRCQLNQVSIAKKLGISQPTVSQHINGKKRNGKKIGGSIRKIKKIIRNMALVQTANSNEAIIIKLLNQLLDKKASYRKGHELLHSLLK